MSTSITLPKLWAMHDALIEALGSPTHSCVIDGVAMTYSSADDVEKRLALINSQIAAATPGDPPSFSYGTVSKDGQRSYNRGNA
jgi:hypothetical protein